MANVRKLIRSLFHSFGLDIHRVSPSPTAQLLASLNRFGVDLVLDVGANTGQFSSELRSVGYTGNIVSFEPLSSAHRALSEVASRDSKWWVHTRCAIGDHDGEIDINIAGNSVSSSVLPMLEAHSLAFKGSAYMGVEGVSLFRLDSVAPAYLAQSRGAFLKIDTQGYEWEVLDGAREVLPRIRGVLCELSLTPLYEGQRLWMDMIHHLETEGFTLWSIQSAVVDPRDERMLQLDGLFFRGC